ncbi:MAG: hypothetical protein ACRCYY_18445 [Trueperaceae bacterium]
MLRYALIVLGSVLVLLVGLSLLPQRRAFIPDATIELQEATVTLYPQQDEEAVWTFSSPVVEYNPDNRDTTLNKVTDGKRIVQGETDFTLESEKVTISSDDNLRGDKIVVRLMEEETTLDMQSKDGRQVQINQTTGEFEIPRVEMSGKSRGMRENMYIAFDLRKARSGGPGTVGYSEFELADRKRNQD